MLGRIGIMESILAEKVEIHQEANLSIVEAEAADRATSRDLE